MKNKLERKQRNTGLTRAASKSAKAMAVRMKIPAELKMKADEIFAAQPAIGSYIRGSQHAEKPSVEEFLVCWAYEILEDTFADLPVITLAQLQAVEADVREELATIADPKVPGWAAWDDDSIAMLTRAGVVRPVVDNASAKRKAFPVICCLIRSLKKKQQPEPVVRKQDDDSDFALEVEGRPDLTELKKHILKKGGDGFQRNSWMAPQVPPGVCKNLLTNGRFITGRRATLRQMRLRGCHENAEKLARRKGMQLWTGFGLLGGCWRVHSWCIQGKRIVETTCIQELYYGVPVRKPFHDLLAKLEKRFGRPGTNAEKSRVISRPTPSA